jgi:hypothetical protein
MVVQIHPAAPFLQKLGTLDLIGELHGNAALLSLVLANSLYPISF